MRTAISFALLLAAFAFIGSDAACADPIYTGKAFADAADVSRVFGSTRFTLESCDQQKSVRIDVDRYDLAADGSLNIAKELLRQSTFYLLQQCAWPGEPTYTTDDSYSARIVLPDGTEAVRASGLFRGSAYGPYDPSKAPMYTVPVYIWQHYQDSVSAARDSAVRESWSASLDRIWHFIQLIAVAALLVWLLTKWQTFVRWYYLLTPHPARSLVYTAVSGGEIDGKLFAQILRPVPGNRIEREVRARQAQELERLARQTESMLRRRAEEAKQKLREEAAYRSAQREMHDATVDAQLAKARADMLDKLAESLRRSAEGNQ